MKHYHPRGISLQDLQKNIVLGKSFFELSYWATPTKDGKHLRRAMFLDKNKAILAYNQIKNENEDRCYSLLEFSFKGSSWDEHIENFDINQRITIFKN